jgi:malonyl-CoA O-methyltransferase
VAGPDRRSVAQAFTRVAAGYTAADFLHREIRASLLERLAPVTLAPAVVVDLGAGPPAATAELAAPFREATVIAVDLAPAMLGAAPQPWQRVAADAARLPFADASVDLVLGAMLLPWCADATAVLAEVRRILRFPGLFAFATLGPDSLHELRAAWPQPDPHSHTLHFADMHNLGDALVRAGFAEPVVDAERFNLSYREFDRGIADLRGVGATDLGTTRRRSLTGRRRWSAMRAAYDSRRDADGLLPVSLEVLFGHAWCGDAARRFVEPAGEIGIPVGKIGRR